MSILRHSSEIPNVLSARILSRVRELAGLGAFLAGPALLPATGLAAEKTIRIPADQPTIGKAMEAAATGDTLLVAPGTYEEVLFVKDGVILKSEAGRDATTIAYGTPSPTDGNEAVVTLQRCSNSTQVVGFTIDGRGIAKRSILALRDGAPVISNCRVRGAAQGINVSGNAAPYVQFTAAKECSTGIVVQGGAGVVKSCELSDNFEYGAVIQGTTTLLEFRDCKILNNLKAGVQGLDGQFTISGGSISGNLNTGVILQLVSPMIQHVLIEGNANIGMVLENCTGTVTGCTIRNNRFGVVISGTGDPKLFQNTFEDNPEFHVGVEGDAVPLIGGSIENANLFLGQADCAIQSGATRPINASYNYWGKPFPGRDLFKQLPGGAQVIRKPWVTADLKTSFTDFEEARKHSRTPVTAEEAAQAASDAAAAEAEAAQQEADAVRKDAEKNAAEAPKDGAAGH